MDQEDALVLSAASRHARRRVEQLGSVDDLYDRPVSAWGGSAGFIGESNLLPAGSLARHARMPRSMSRRWGDRSRRAEPCKRVGQRGVC